MTFETAQHFHSEQNRSPQGAVPARPPAEVLDAIGAAFEAYDRLQASGRELHFDLDSETGKLTVQLLDAEGEMLGILPAWKVLDIAAGEPLDC
jgi:hypothetical protein